MTQRLTVTWVGIAYGDLGGLFQPEWVCDGVILWWWLEETTEITKSSHEGRDVSTNYQQPGLSRTEQSGPSWPGGAALGPALVSWVIGPAVGQPCPGVAHCASVLGSVQLAFGRGECWGEFFQELLFVEKHHFWGVLG